MSRNGRRVGMVYPSLGHGPTQTTASEYGHPAHRGFARSVGADDVVVDLRTLPGPLAGPLLGDTLLTDVYSTAVTRYPERDVFVTENDAMLYAAPVLKRRFPDATVLHLAASDRLLGTTAVRRPDDTRLRAAKRRLNARLDHALLRRAFARYCDGAIAVSSFARDCIRAFTDDVPVRVVEPYVQPAVRETLADATPALDGATAVTVGAWRDHKGVELLVDAWPRVRERHPDAELRIVGPGHPTQYADTLGVTLRGFVPSLAAELAAAAVYVHPAHVEAFGVSVVEAQCAGLPAVVTETTGARSAVETVDESMVVPPTPAALADAVADYFDRPLAERRALSAASRDAAAEYTEEAKTAAFRRAFESLVG